jgi:hypothetical protein
LCGLDVLTVAEGDVADVWAEAEDGFAESRIHLKRNRTITAPLTRLTLRQGAAAYDIRKPDGSRARGTSHSAGTCTVTMQTATGIGLGVDEIGRSENG